MEILKIYACKWAMNKISPPDDADFWPSHGEVKRRFVIVLQDITGVVLTNLPVTYFNFQQ